MAGSTGLAKRVFGIPCAVALASAVLGASAPLASAAGEVDCHQYAGIHVALAAGQPASYTVAGELCATPGELMNGETVQLLMHGATYNHTYWDFGTIDGRSYSYARDVAASGFPTFAIDEIGAGDSSHPPSAAITLDTAAYVEHEIIQDLRDGVIAGTSFGKVIGVGHSGGSFISWVEAYTYHDVDGVIITGAVHSVTTYLSTALATDFYPATLDPKFAGAGLDPAYLTSTPGKRASLFYNTDDSDPTVIARDEATKDVVSTVEIAGAATLLVTPATRQITAPVLVIMGGDDRLLCGPEADAATFSCSSGQAVANEEAPYYSEQAELRACVEPGSGHDLNLALNHDVEEADALAWSSEYVGQSGVPAVTSHGLPADCSSSQPTTSPG